MAQNRNIYPKPVYRKASDPASDAMKTLNIVFVAIVVVGLLWFASSMGIF